MLDIGRLVVHQYSQGVPTVSFVALTSMHASLSAPLALSTNPKLNRFVKPRIIALIVFCTIRVTVCMRLSICNDLNGQPRLVDSSQIMNNVWRENAYRVGCICVFWNQQYDYR